jgi:hypothetical protein
MSSRRSTASRCMGMGSRSRSCRPYQLGFLRMETTLRLGPPRLWTGSPLPPRRSLSHGRNTMQVDADMPSPHNAPPSQPNSAAPTPTPASNHPPRQGSAAPIRARSGMYSDREVAAGTPSADGGSVPRGPRAMATTPTGVFQLRPCECGCRRGGQRIRG